jgi:hypothetical protein
MGRAVTRAVCCNELPHAAAFPPCVNYVSARRNDNVVTYAADSTANFINAINFNARQREGERQTRYCVCRRAHIGRAD